jgi:Putative binding domain, N-terminal
VVGPASMNVPGTGLNYTVSVFTRGDWEIEIPLEATWVTALVNGAASGTDDGIVNVAVARNETDFSRSTTIYIAGQSHYIFQAARATTISPASKSISAAGGSYYVAVNTIGQVTATVITGSDWLTATADSTTRNVLVVVAANTSSTKRVGTINISGKIHTVTQSGVSVSISASKSPYIPANGGMYDIRVTSDGPWTISVPVTWVGISINGVAGVPTDPTRLPFTYSGTGNAIVTVTVGAYNGLSFPVARSTTISIGGKNHVITQDWKLRY